MTDEATEGEKKEVKEKSASPFAKKVIKLLTVAAYMSGVSGAGVLLSLYYIIFWDPRITGVRPPGYLKSGEPIGLPQTSARVAPTPLPEAFSGRQPIAYPHKMSKEFMDAYLKNYTEDSADRVLGMLEGDPTPKVLPVAGEDPPAAPTHTPPSPALYNPPLLQPDSSSSSSSSQQRHHSAASLQHRQERHPQRPRHGQGDPLLMPAA
ncbi:uncharacterized protein LOC126998015 [Eriocheir sinensis]|uniref:uncharacterized protein LOC126998015 n=1 Tax=Eriocheir sinensis TaxID=95602 RepID=UPI0021C9E6AD|nr:uncharacterized protein LOC126998015 [Eriocheir sinensis]